jgi:hypothetical protein
MYMGIKDFDSLYERMKIVSEARTSPYGGAHPAFKDITSKMRAGGLSSAPLDTIKFIRETLYFLDIIGDEELDNIKKSPGFSGKKTAMLSILKQKQAEINSRADEISQRVEETLDNFIGGVGVDRGREDKYTAQATAQEIDKQMKQVKAGKKMEDALSDIVSDESILVKASVARILGNIQQDLGEPGLDIDEEALEEVINYSSKIDSLEKLKSFVSQISKEPGYQEIAAYLSSAIKPITSGLSGGEENEEGEDIESYYDPTDGTGSEDEYDEVMREESIEDVYKQIDDIVYGDYESGFHYIVDDEGSREANPDIWNRYRSLVSKAIEMTDGNGPAYKVDPMKYGDFSDSYKSDNGRRPRFEISYNEMEEWFKNRDEARQRQTGDVSYGESYTLKYMAGEKRTLITNQPNLQTFKERFKPKNIHQLIELSNYGLR